MRRYSLKLKKHTAVKLPSIPDGIEFNDERRLRNALIALAGLDPDWKRWLAENVPAVLSLGERRQLVERQARALVAKRYAFMGRDFSQAIIESDYYFLDDGNLKGHA